MRLAPDQPLSAAGAGGGALAAGRRVPGKRKCAVVSGGNLDAGVLAALLRDIRPRPPRKPRRRVQEAPVAWAVDGPVLDIAEARAGASRLRPAAAARHASTPSAPAACFEDCPT